MADPKTILDGSKKRRDDAAAALTAMQAALASAQTNIAASREDIAQASSALAGLEKRAAEIRRQLSAVPTPADGETLLDALEQVIIRLRLRQGEILKAQADLNQAKASADGAQARLPAMSAIAAATQAEVKQAEAAHKQRQKLKDVLMSQPLASLPADADAALTGPQLVAAEARLKKDLTPKLFDRAEKRHGDETERINQAVTDAQKAEDDRLAELDPNGGLVGKAEQARIKFLRLEAAAGNLVSGAAESLQEALAALAQVADETQFSLTPEQRKRIDTGDPALKAKREAIADKEDAPTADWLDAFKALDAGIAAVAAAQAAFAQEIQNAIAAKKNPDTDPMVTAAKDKLKVAQTALAAAEDHYKDSEHGILHAWESAVPDTLWRLFENFETAKDTLKTLKDAAPAQFKSNLDQAEEDYTAAWLKADNSQNKIEQLTAEQMRLATLRQNALQSADQRRFSASRGDY